METDMSGNKLSVYNETFCSAPPLVTSNISSLVQRAIARGSEGAARRRKQKRAVLSGSTIRHYIWLLMHDSLIQIFVCWIIWIELKHKGVEKIKSVDIIKDCARYSASNNTANTRTLWKLKANERRKEISKSRLKRHCHNRFIIDIMSTVNPHLLN